MRPLPAMLLPNPRPYRHLGVGVVAERPAQPSVFP